MVLLGLFLLIVAVTAGTSSVVVLWPLYAVGAALLYCLDRPQRRNARLTLAAIGVAAAIGYRFGPWHHKLHAPAGYVWFAVPLAVALLIVLGAGGPRRIRARHERNEQARRRQRAEAVARARTARAERGAQRRTARRETIRRKTGVDVGLVADATLGKARKAGERVTRRLERHRPARPPSGPPDLLDLGQDVNADLSRRRNAEILRLAGELDDTRRPRPGPR